MERSIRPEKCLLSHVLGPTTIPAEPVGEIHERALPAPHQSLECGVVAGEHFFHIRQILSGTHPRFLMVRLAFARIGCIFCSGTPKNATKSQAEWTQSMDATVRKGLEG